MQGDVQHQIKFQTGLKPWRYANRRVGAPKHIWSDKATETRWNEMICKTERLRQTRLNLSSNDVVTEIRNYARRTEDDNLKK